MEKALCSQLTLNTKVYIPLARTRHVTPPRTRRSVNAVVKYKLEKAAHHLCYKSTIVKNASSRDFPGISVAKTSPSNAGGVGLIPGRGAKIPTCLVARKQNIKQKQYCSKLYKTLKMVHIKKKKNLKKNASSRA